MNDKEIEEFEKQKERQKAWFIETIDDFNKDLESVKREIETTGIDMLNPNQIDYLSGMVYAIGSIINTLKNYTNLLPDGYHEDILNFIDSIIKK